MNLSDKDLAFLDFIKKYGFRVYVHEPKQLICTSVQCQDCPLNDYSDCYSLENYNVDLIKNEYPHEFI